MKIDGEGDQKGPKESWTSYMESPTKTTCVVLLDLAPMMHASALISVAVAVVVAERSARASIIPTFDVPIARTELQICGKMCGLGCVTHGPGAHA